MNNSSLIELLPGARNCVSGYAGIEKDENVLIWTDRGVNPFGSGVDPSVIQALSVASEEAGADVTIISTKEWRPKYGDLIPKLVRQAICDSDVFINVFSLQNMASVDNKYYYRSMLEYNTRNVMFLPTSPELLASRWARFPVDLHFAILDKAGSKIKDVNFQLTCPNGTDLSGRFMGAGSSLPTYADPRSSKKSRKILIFPGGEIADHPVSEVEGTIVFEAFDGFRGLLHQNIKLTVKEHRITSVEGGTEAEWLKRLMKKHKNSDYLAEVSWGNNPSTSLSRALRERAVAILFRRAGTFHCGLGLWYTIGLECDLHLDGGGRTCTLRIGDDTIVDNGYVKILGDPQIRAIAARYGDPDDVLAYEP